MLFKDNALKPYTYFYTNLNKSEMWDLGHFLTVNL